jgi:hypothetical protein
MERALSSLADDTVGAIVGVLHALSGEERAHVRRVLSQPGQPGDVRTRVIQKAVAVEQPGLRSELVRLVRVAGDTALLEALDRCIVPGGVDLGPLLEHLGSRVSDSAGPGYEALARLVGEHTEASLAQHVSDVAARLWTYTMIAEALAARDAGAGEAARGVAARARARQRELLDHLLAAAGLAAPAPDRALRMMRAALGEERYVSSLALEVLEEWLPQRVRAPVFPVLEAFADAAARRARAYEIAGLSAEGAESRAMEAAAREGLA